MPTSKPSLFQQIYQALESRGKLRTQGKGFRTNCPNTEHQDRNPSFFLFQSGAGRCYSQCDQYWKPLELAQLLGIAATTGEVGLTVQQLAEAKRLPEDFLRAHGVTDGVSGNKRSPCVDIPYLDESAGVTGMRKRVSLFGNPQFLWRRGDKPSLYGLEDLGVARMLGYAVLVEGESDRWTLKYAGFPAFGVPGVSTWQESWASHLSGLRTYLWNEPDAAADSLLGKVSQDLPDLLVITPPQSIKDPSELFQYDPGSFKDQFQALMAAA